MKTVVIVKTQAEKRQLELLSKDWEVHLHTPYSIRGLRADILLVKTPWLFTLEEMMEMVPITRGH